MPQAAASPISGRLHARRATRRGRRSFTSYDRWVDDALRHRADGSSLLDSTLPGVPGVQRLARRRCRRSAFVGVHAALALHQHASARVSAILSPRQALALQLFCDEQPMTAIATRLGLCGNQHLLAAYRRPAMEAVTREFLALAPAESPPN